MKRIISFFIILLSLFLLFINQDRIIDNYNTLRIELMPNPMATNTYDKGQCTYYVFDKVKKDGNMIERSWRDAKHWAKLAKQDGYNVNHSPRKGALLQSPRGTQGHVAYIEHVYQNGNVKVSEMNYTQPYEITERIIYKKDLSRYKIIHPKINPKKY
ncbi:CHAP domain-containing protein [Macrococcoides goetzii]|uniref:CHAP domain-containing protein n=1 Tax=Macrococcoides goetzii TaxID=1891097 RepID=A0A2G5NSZ6_9STAP|nr:CHAP domain-containing protein [Macrococcus goetzii]RAI82486.1 CHAP domain-containing protein [Macrococcus goetzii]